MLDVDRKPLEAKNRLMAIVPLFVLAATAGAGAYVLYFFVAG